MYSQFFRAALFATVCLACIGVTASAAPISYLYIYDTVDGTGAMAMQPSTNPADTHADSLHPIPYTTYGSGELNDGWDVPEGTWDAGAGYIPSHNRYNFWDSNGGHQVGKGDNGFSVAKPSLVAKFDDIYDIGTITVNYETMFASGIRAPGMGLTGLNRAIKAYFGVDDGAGGITWSAAADLPGWKDDNPARFELSSNASNIWVNEIDVTGMAGSSDAQYVRLDFTSDGEWMSLIEVGFADSAPIPEPSTLALLSAGLLGLLCYAWRKRK